MTKPHIAIIWSRFGPYHLARLRGAAEIMPQALITGVEIASDDRSYDWSIESGADGFERLTVFPSLNYHDLSHPRIASGVTDTLEALSPDAVAINGWSAPEARAALSWAKRRKAQAILMSETKADDVKRVWWKETIKGIIVRQFDNALVGGRQQAEYLIALGFPEERIRPGYDAIDNTYFEAGSNQARDDDERMRAKFGLPNTYFFACTRFLKRKNIDGLLRAYALYCAGATAPWALVIAGSGEEDSSLRHLARTLGVEDAVHWPGFVQYPELPIYFGLAGAFIHPAKSEAWGLVVNEAAASALPLLVARSVGAASELVVEGKTGLSFDPFDDCDIARALTNIATAKTTARHEMGQRARSEASRWSPTRFGTELFTLIGDASLGNGK